MPAWGNPHREDYDDSWKLVLFIRHLGNRRSKKRHKPNAWQNRPTTLAHKPARSATPICMRIGRKRRCANVVRDPREHPDAIFPDLASNSVSAKFTQEKVVLVYGSPFGNNVTSQKRETITFPNPLNGM